MTHHERLTALDASFLGIETDVAHMHVGAVIVFAAGPLREDGGVAFERIERYIERGLDRMPRYRQRLAWVPGLSHPVWVDDDQFNIHYHVRHTALPHPGDERVLKRLAGRIFSQKLDRSRPLWEVWIVEGLEGDRFAIITKVHHCMIDGVAGVDLMAQLLRGTADDSVPEHKPWTPRPAPTGSELLASEMKHRAGAVRRVAGRTREAMHGLGEWWGGAREKLGGVANALQSGMVPASPCMLNPKHIGPHRRFDVCRMELERVKQVKRRLGGTVNDVVLTTATTALARYLGRHGADVGGLDDFRALVPVNVRKASEHGAGGNRVAMMIAPLPIAELDLRERYQRVCETMTYLKTESHQAEGSQMLEEIGDFTAPNLVRQIFRFAGRQRAFNVVITNVPGPPFPLYLLGSKLEAIYPLVPLFENQSVGLALFSYTGGLYWGLSADWSAVPDLHELAGDLRAAFDELYELATGSPEQPEGSLGDGDGGRGFDREGVRVLEEHGNAQRAGPPGVDR